jgi:hypothetical protein
VTGSPPLTPSERVGCASFALYVKELDKMTGSTRLSALLAEDLDIRRNSTRNKNKNKNKNSSGKNNNTANKQVEGGSQGRKGESQEK